MTAKQGQHEVSAVERLEDRLLFSAGHPAMACSQEFVEKPHAYADAFMEKPCVVVAPGIEDELGGDLVPALPDAGTGVTRRIIGDWDGDGMDDLHRISGVTAAAGFSDAGTTWEEYVPAGWDGPWAFGPCGWTDLDEATQSPKGLHFLAYFQPGANDAIPRPAEGYLPGAMQGQQGVAQNGLDKATNDGRAGIWLDLDQDGVCTPYGSPGDAPVLTSDWTTGDQEGTGGVVGVALAQDSFGNADDDCGGISLDSWQTNGSASDVSAWSGTWPGMRVGGVDGLVNHNLQSALWDTSYCEKPLA